MAAMPVWMPMDFIGQLQKAMWPTPGSITLARMVKY